MPPLWFQRRPDSLLTYTVGDRCGCKGEACAYRHYQAAMFFGVIRVLMGRN